MGSLVALIHAEAGPKPRPIAAPVLQVRDEIGHRHQLDARNLAIDGPAG
jgi:hypothetical protein